MGNETDWQSLADETRRLRESDEEAERLKAEDKANGEAERWLRCGPLLEAACRKAQRFVENMKVPQTAEDGAMQMWLALGVLKSLTHALTVTEESAK